jgi:ATP-dependent DNA ligase
MENVMLAYTSSEKRLRRWNSDQVIVQPKINGLRCHAIRQTGGRFRLFSREDNEFTQLPLINAALENMAFDNVRPLHFDGELYVHGMSLQDIRTICKRTTTQHPDHDVMEFHIFDRIPFYVEPSKSQTSRLLSLNQLLCWPHKQDRQRIHIVPFYQQNLDEVDSLLAQHLSEGYEGIMLRNPNALYEFRRSNNLLKLKPRQIGAFTILYANEAIDIYGMPKDTLGSLTLRLVDQRTFHCGAGQLTHPQRQFLWDHRDQLPGKTAHIHYQELSDAGIPQQPILRYIEGVEYDY